MRPFRYARAENEEDASRHSAAGATFIAGGTNLLDLMKLEVMAPDDLVDINRLDLKSISKTSDGGLRIGALVTNSDCAAHPDVRSRYPLLAKAILAGASGQLRNKATTGGNLCQRTRCYYFYDTAQPCNKRDPGSGCGAIGGVNRLHAILGASDQCIATYPGDMAVAMTALDAVVEIQSADGTSRSVPITDFHRLPGDHPDKDNILDPGDLITAVTLPPTPKGLQIYRKVRDRSSYAFALVSVAAIVEMDGDTIREARLAFGGLAHKPWRDPGVEAELAGANADKSRFGKAADILLKDAKGQGSNDFKIPLAHRTLVAVLSEATRSGVNK